MNQALRGYVDEFDPGKQPRLYPAGKTHLGPRHSRRPWVLSRFDRGEHAGQVVAQLVAEIDSNLAAVNQFSVLEGAEKQAVDGVASVFGGTPADDDELLAAEGVDLIRGQARKMTIDHVLSNGFGFGGVNASVIFRKI